MRIIGTIYWNDIKRLFSNFAIISTLVGLILLPCFYAWFTTWGYMDPYTRITNLPVAVVNDDRGAVEPTGQRLDIGAGVIAGMKEHPALDWKFVDKNEAMEGVKSGKYFGAFIIPSDFSQSILDLANVSKLKNPQHPYFDYYVNEKINDVTPQILRGAVDGIKDDLNQGIIKNLSQQLIIQMRLAAQKGQDKVGSIQGKALTLVTQASTLLGTLQKQINYTSKDLTKAQADIRSSQEALRRIENQISEVQKGLAQTNTLLSETRTNLVNFSSTASDRIGNAAAQSGVFSAEINNQIGKETGALLGIQGVVGNSLDMARSPLKSAQDILQKLQNINSSLLDLQFIKATLTNLQSVTSAADSAITSLQGTNANLGDTIVTLKKTTQTLNTRITATLNKVAQLSQKFNNTSIAQASDGLGSLQSATTLMSEQLNGLKRNATSAISFLDGLYNTNGLLITTLNSTAEQFGQTQHNIQTAATTLASVTSSFAIQQLQKILQTNADQISSFISDPAVFKTETLFSIRQYGAAMAPMFTTLASWIGAFMLVIIVRLEVGRRKTIPHTPRQGYIARLLLLMTIAATQGLVCTIGDLLIGIHVDSIPQFLFAGVWESIVFMSLIYMFATCFQLLGKAFILSLVIIQVPGSGGVYPVQMMPEIYQNLHPLLPFTYGIDMFRGAVAGDYHEGYWFAFGILLAYGLGAFIIGLIVRPTLLNLNILFDRKLAQTDFFIGEGRDRSLRHISLIEMVRVLASGTGYREQIIQKRDQFNKIYPRLIKLGFILVVVVPIIPLVLLFSVNAKLIMLVLWSVAVLVGFIFLIVVEYIHSNLNEQIALDDIKAASLKTALRDYQQTAGDYLTASNPMALSDAIATALRETDENTIEETEITKKKALKAAQKAAKRAAEDVINKEIAKTEEKAALQRDKFAESKTDSSSSSSSESAIAKNSAAKKSISVDKDKALSDADETPTTDFKELSAHILKKIDKNADKNVDKTADKDSHKDAHKDLEAEESTQEGPKKSILQGKLASHITTIKSNLKARRLTKNKSEDTISDSPESDSHIPSQEQPTWTVGPHYRPWMNAWILCWRDIKSWSTNTIGLIVVSGLIMVPALYAWFNIGGSWNLYENVKDLPVAVINEDKGFQSNFIPAGINVGNTLTDTLRREGLYKWEFVSPQEGMNGVKTGRYYGAVVIPPDFSADIMTLFSPHMKRPVLKFYINDKANPLTPKILEGGALNVKTNVNQIFIKDITSAALQLAFTLGRYLTTPNAIDSYQMLQKNISEQAQALGNLGTLTGSYGRVIESVQALLRTAPSVLPSPTVKQNVEAVRGKIKQGVDQERNAIKSASSIMGEAMNEVTQSFDGLSANLTEALNTLGSARTQALDGISSTASTMGSLGKQYESLGKQLKSSADSIPSIPIIGGPFNDLRNLLLTQSKNAESTGKNLIKMQTTLNQSLTTLKQNGADIAQTLRKIKAQIIKSKDQLVQFNNSSSAIFEKQMDQIQNLMSGLGTQAVSIAGGVDTAIIKVNTASKNVSEQLNIVSSTLNKIRGSLMATSKEIQDFATKFGDALKTGNIEKIRSILELNPEELTNLVTIPIVYKEHVVFPVKPFGSAISSFYTSLALWLGALLVAVLIATTYSENKKRGLRNLKPHQLYWGRQLAITVIVLLQALLLVAGCMWYLRVQVLHPWLLLLLGVVAAIVFSTMTYVCTLVFGYVGELFIEIFLIVQITAAGGTYPTQLMPPFFGMIQPYLPVTYMIRAMRSCVAGIYNNDYWIQLGYLCCFFVASMVVVLILRRPLEGFKRWVKRSFDKTGLIA